MNSDQEIVRLSELPRLFSVSKSSIYVWIKQGLLPRPFRLGIGCSAMLRSEVHDILCFYASCPTLEEKKAFIANLPSQKAQRR